MSHYPMADSIKANTHDVENMPEVLENYNVFDNDPALKEGVIREGGEWALDRLQNFGEISGSASTILAGTQANQNKPTLQTHNRYGHRVDEVEFHPAYHQLMASSIGNGIGGLPWAEPKAGAHVARAASFYMQTQVEAGHLCPVCMTYASVPTLKKQANIADIWLPKVMSSGYDPRNVSYQDKQSLTIGMAMTEKQGGSDVRRNSTKAYPIGQAGAGMEYELVGHKFFVSAPMCDAFLVLAQAEGGISCFLVPRWRPDGSKNPMQVIRLKDKMGNVSNASSETELRGAFGWLIGEEGRGIANILEMVACTRFDCVSGSAGQMRAHMYQIVHHTSQREAFGNRLDKQPLMQNVLADLSLEAEAATAMAMRLGRGMDESGMNEEADMFTRIATAVCKYWVCKRAPGHAYESMEAIGGSAVMENSLMPRFYREAPVNSIWEGSGNVQCLDVLRAMGREPASLDAFIGELEKTRGQDKRFDNHLNGLLKEFKNRDDIEYRARHIVEQMALGLQGSLLIQAGNSSIADAYCAGRLEGNSGNTYGMLPKGVDVETLIDRCRIAG